VLLIQDKRSSFKAATQNQKN